MTLLQIMTLQYMFKYDNPLISTSSLVSEMPTYLHVKRMHAVKVNLKNK